MKLPLAYFGDPVLRKKADSVDKITDDIRQLVADMTETMDELDGIGIAAPQVHRSLRVFVTRVPVKQEDGTWSDGTLRIFINPKILNHSLEAWTYSEGCLSIPKLHGNVIRPWRITVQATDLEGNDFVEDFEGLQARCIMHENDHINGVLYIDRMTPASRKEFEPVLREIKKKYSHK